MKVLIAEDDENSRTLLEIVLSAAGFEVVSFDNGLKAFAHLQAYTVDLIISDILMPEMDGYGLCRAVKQSHHLEKIPFIFYTATYTTSQDERFAMSLGASKLLLKPMLMPDFLKVVQEVLASETSGAPKNRGLYRSSPLKLDKQHADRVRAKLDEKVVELNVEKQKLIDLETRCADFITLSDDWFWEADSDSKLSTFKGKPKHLNCELLTDLVKTYGADREEELQKLIQAHQPFTDFIFSFQNAEGKTNLMRISAKPIFDDEGGFTGYRGVGSETKEAKL